MANHTAQETAKTAGKVQDFQKYQEQGAYHWSTLKPSFKTTFNPYLHARYAVALKQIPRAAKDGAVAVDLGCGDGYIANQLATSGYEVFGVDGSKEAIGLGRNLTPEKFKDKIHLQVGNVTQTKLKADSADLVISLDVIEHLDNAEDMLKEMLRVAKNGATVLIGTPVRFTENPMDKYHVREFYCDEFKELLGNYFEVVELKKSHPVEWVALMRRKFSLFGKQKNLGWNLLNTWFMITKKNPLAVENSDFPTYQFAVCRVKK